MNSRTVKSLVVEVMADGRERTSGDLESKLSQVNPDAIRSALYALSRDGVLLSDAKIHRIPIYRIARGRK